MANMKLLREVMDTILAKPDEWDQGSWAVIKPEAEGGACRTAYCVAGWACVLSGEQLRYEEAPISYIPRIPMARGYLYADYTEDGVDIGERAQFHLDLDEITADILFDGDNSLETIKHYVDVIGEKGFLTYADDID